MAPADGLMGPNGAPIPRAPALRPPPWRPPPPPPDPPPDVLWVWAGALSWVCSRRCGSSLSAWLRVQWPLKSTPVGGAWSSFSLAPAARQSTARTTTRIHQSYNEPYPDGYGAPPEGYGAPETARQLAGMARTGSGAQIVGSANPDAAFE